jgi:hypothetical protein
LLDLAAIRVEHSVKYSVMRVTRRFEHECLIEAHTRMPVAERAQAGGIEMTFCRSVEYEEVVPQTLHLQKVEAHIPIYYHANHDDFD